MATDARQDPFDGFDGYELPHYTQVPDQFLDVHLRHLPPHEVVVMLVLFRATLGWRRPAFQLTNDEIASRAGVSNSGARKSLKSLEGRGLICVDRRNAETGEPNTFSVRMAQGGVSRGSTRGATPCPPKTYRQNDTDKGTPSIPLADLAASFLRSIGYPKPSKAKRERTLRVLNGLVNGDGFTLDELRVACEAAAALGARGPELIPHVIGQAAAPAPPSKAGEKIAQAQAEERDRWRELRERFDALPSRERERLVQAARRSNNIVAQRPPDHPLVIAAAVSLLGEGVTS